MPTQIRKEPGLALRVFSPVIYLFSAYTNDPLPIFNSCVEDGQFIIYNHTYQYGMETFPTGISWYGPGTTWDEDLRLKNKNKLIVPPFTIFIYTKNLRLEGWRQGFVHLILIDSDVYGRTWSTSIVGIDPLVDYIIDNKRAAAIERFNVLFPARAALFLRCISKR